MSRTVVRVLAPLVILLGSGCDQAEAPRQAPPAHEPETRPSGDGVAPETSAIVAREGDHLYVVIDIAPRDAQGRRVLSASAETDATTRPVAATRPTTRGERLAVEIRVPAATREIKLTGTSEGGVPWSSSVSTRLP